MIKRLMLALVLPSLVIAAEQGTPEWIVESFFVAKEFPEKEQYYTGEMLQYLEAPTLGASLPESVRATTRVVRDDAEKRYFAIHYTDEKDSRDWYAFVVLEDGSWKLQAVRQLWLPPFFYALLEEYRQNEARTEEEEWEYQNMLLTASPDADLKAYLRRHRKEFDRLLGYFLKNPELREIRGPQALAEEEAGSSNKAEKGEDLVRALHLNRVHRHESNPSLIVFNIGGMIDNAVGFLYVPEGTDPPEMGPERYIYIEQIEGGWYILKTT